MTFISKPKNWDHVIMQMAFVISSMSKDPSTKVGAVLVSPDRTRLSVGYNGFPSRIPDYTHWWQNRDPNTDDFCKYDLVRHAEMNAITQAKTDLKGWTIYITHHPCLECAKHIVSEGISRVVYTTSSDQITMEIKIEKIQELFKIAQVQFNQLPQEELSKEQESTPTEG
jgi:dCMP deaminase